VVAKVSGAVYPPAKRARLHEKNARGNAGENAGGSGRIPAGGMAVGKKPLPNYPATTQPD
jgi:hypothetical protein